MKFLIIILLIISLCGCKEYNYRYNRNLYLEVRAWAYVNRYGLLTEKGWNQNQYISFDTITDYKLCASAWFPSYTLRYLEDKYLNTEPSAQIKNFILVNNLTLKKQDY
jgi:hypothetical protein